MSLTKACFSGNAKFFCGRRHIGAKFAVDHQAAEIARLRFGVRQCPAAFHLNLTAGKTIVPRSSSDQPRLMPARGTPWPHAPTHQLSGPGTYFVTVGTYLKEHHFRSPERLDVLHRGLLIIARDFSWELEAWAIFSNHYHFVAHSPTGSDISTSLSQMLGVLHTRTASWVNRVDKTPSRKVWHNFWETKLTYQKSYFARLNYVHQNR